MHVFGYFMAKNTTLLHADHGEKTKASLKKARLPNGIYELRKQTEHTPQGLVPVRD